MFTCTAPLFKIIGWALLNSIWQFAVLQILYYFFTKCYKNSSATAKHTMALGLVFLGIGWVSITVLYSNSFYAALNNDNSPFTIAGNSYYNLWFNALKWADSAMYYCTILYVGCVLFLFFKLLLLNRQVKSLQTSVENITEDWINYIKKSAIQIGIHKHVSAVLSWQVDTPQVIGFLNPIILIPVASITYLTVEQLKAVLLHELAHIKRNDYIINIILVCIEIIFFFNPFVKYFTTTIRTEREYSCDDVVINAAYEPKQYAMALLTVEKNRRASVVFGIAASGRNKKQLLTRIERMVGINNKKDDATTLLAGVTTFLLFGLITGLSIASMENASIAKQQKYITNVITIQSPKNSTAIRVQNKNKRLPIKRYTTACNGLPIKIITAASTIVNAKDSFTPLAITCNFSLLPNEGIALLTTEKALPTPYIPENYFLYQFIQSTTPDKLEIYKKDVAREVMVKTEKIFNAIDWKQMQQNVECTQEEYGRLQLYIAQQLIWLNWLTKYNEIKATLQQEIKNPSQVIVEKPLLLLQEKVNKDSLNELSPKQCKKRPIVNI